MKRSKESLKEEYLSLNLRAVNGTIRPTEIRRYLKLLKRFYNSKRVDIKSLSKYEKAERKALIKKYFG